MIAHFLAALFYLASWQTQGGRASVFFPHEALNDGFLACDHGRRWTDPGEMVCAHRTLPCGTELLVTHKGKSAICRVLDRGPYGRTNAAGEWNRTEGKYNAVIDLGPAVAKAIGFPGTGHVRLWWKR